MSRAAYTRSGDRFVPTDDATSGWGLGLVAGGPACGLIAHAIERFAAEPEMEVTRLTIDLLYPVPKQPLDVVTRTVRRGKRIHVVEASLKADGKEVTRASGLLLHTSDAGSVSEELPAAPPPPEDAAPLQQQFDPARWPLGGFALSVERRRVPPAPDSEARYVWMRPTLPLIEDEDWTPLSRVAALCDALNAMSGVGRKPSYGSINADVTVYLHRQQVGEWLCIDARRVQTGAGIGTVHGPIFDVEGAIGASAGATLFNEQWRQR